MRIYSFLCLAVLLFPVSSSGQTYPEIKWWTDLDAPSFGSAATADLDGDGLPELVFGTYFNDEAIHCLNGEDGSHSWTFETGGCNDASPVICDVDGDGGPEVVVPCSSTQTVHCLDGATGEPVWSTDEGYCIDSPPAVADVDSDGDLEVVNGTFNGHVFCLDADSGYVQWETGLGSGSYIQSCPNIHDFDCDGEPEIVVAQWMGDCRVYCLDGATGDVEWYSDAPGDWMYHGGSYADVDGDGLPEIAIGSYDSNVYLLNGEDGSTEWQFTASAYACGPTCIADLDGNAGLEVVYSTGSGIGVLNGDGSPSWSCGCGGSVFRGAVVTNIDGDTIPDLVYGTSGGDLAVRRGSAGELIWELDLQAHYGDTYDIDHAPVTGDFDGDGSMDVFVIGGYGTSSSPTDNHGRAYMISAGDGNGPGWTMFRHDRFRSGCFDGGGTGIQGHGGPGCLPGIKCVPNPCRGSTTVCLTVPSGQEELRISVYDLSGRRVAGPVHIAGDMQSYTLDTSGLVPGVYFVAVSGRGAFQSGRLLVME